MSFDFCDRTVIGTGAAQGIGYGIARLFAAAIPLGRFADATEMAPPVAFLASEEAGYITATVLAVDGGMSM